MEMNRRHAVLFVCLFLCAAGAMFPTFAQTTSEESAVRQTVNTYLHGLKFNDIESFRKAFHPGAKLFFVRANGALGELTQEQWYRGFATSAGKEEPGDLQIAALDITGKAASVKVVEIYADSTYTDYISLLKLTDGWKIVNKIFVMEKRAAQ
jgi:Putative lumazine-binding